MSNGIYDILGKLNGLKPKDNPVSMSAEPVYESVDTHGDIMTAVNSLEVKYIEYKKGEAVLDKPYEDNPEAKKAGDAYASFNSILKELTEIKLAEAEGGKTPDAKTTNDLPTGTLSPVGSNQNKIPKAKK